MVKFIIHKYFSTNFMVLRRTGELHATDLQIIIHIFLYIKKAVKKCSSRSRK
jgi:hypothetical protein